MCELWKVYSLLKLRLWFISPRSTRGEPVYVRFNNNTCGTFSWFYQTRNVQVLNNFPPPLNTGRGNWKRNRVIIALGRLILVSSYLTRLPIALNVFGKFVYNVYYYLYINLLSILFSRFHFCTVKCSFDCNRNHTELIFKSIRSSNPASVNRTHTRYSW